MLVLTRKSDESVVVGGADCFERMVKVTVLEICGGSVKLGFEADRNVPVHRWEVWERIRSDRKEQQSADEAILAAVCP